MENEVKNFVNKMETVDYVSLLKPSTNGGLPERIETELKKGMPLGRLDEVWGGGSSPYSIFFLKIENAIREWKSDPNSEVVVVDSVAPGCNVEFDFKKTLEFQKKNKINVPAPWEMPPVLYSEEFKENTLKKAFESAKSWPRLGEVIANGIPGIKFYDHRSSGLKKPTGFELPENVWYFLSKSKHACGCSFQVKSYVSAFGWGRKEVHGWHKEMDHLFAKANQKCPVARHGDDFEVTGTHEHWVWVELANREKNKPEILFS